MIRKAVLPKIDPVPFTKEGFEKIQAEQKQLFIDRVDAIEHLKKSRELGDLKENGYYQASRQKVNAIDARLRRIKFLLKYGVVASASQTDIVEIGSFIELLSGKEKFTYQIVGGEESNPSQGKISHKSPLGRLLMGKKIGEKIELHAPAGVIVYNLLRIF
ncbi:MAG: GreA/GreB family elongation factor [Candidatus Levybacteria bacterium]|nr:GreA/GreB family elongation factor [Candidatus Levybacteria bacterium]